MKKYWVVMLAVLMCLAFIASALAKDNAVITDSRVRLRPAPSINAGVLRELGRGTRVEVLAHTDFVDSYDGYTGFWYYIEYKHIFGYVFGKYIEVDAGVNVLPESECVLPGR